MTKRGTIGALSVAWLGCIAAGRSAGAQPQEHPPPEAERAESVARPRHIESGNILCVLRAMRDLPGALDSLHAMADMNGDGRVSKQEALGTAYFIAGGFFFGADRDGDLAVTPDESRQARDRGLPQYLMVRLMLLHPYGHHEPRPWRSLIQLAGMDDGEPIRTTDVRDGIQAGVDGLFSSVDTSRDGYITREESRAALADIVRAAGRAAFERIDRNEDGMLSQEEVEDDIVTSARLGFAMADQNGDGMLTKQEAAAAVKVFGDTTGCSALPRAPLEPAPGPLQSRSSQP